MKAIDCAAKLNGEVVGRLKQAGIQAIGRYLGPEESWKALSNSEAKTILAAGLGIFSIWETNPVRCAYFTESQAEKDAADAAHFAASVGQPAGTPIYFTVDYDAGEEDLGTIVNYFRRIRGIRYSIGAYGSFRVIESLARSGTVDFFYQTYAWSGGRQSGFAHIYQYRNDRILSGIRVDDNRILSPAGIWAGGKSRDLMAGKPKLLTKNNISPRSGSYPGYLIRRGSRGEAVRRIQHIVGTAEDGLFGPITEQAVRVWQKGHRLEPDGIVGPLTWKAMF